MDNDQDSLNLEEDLKELAISPSRDQQSLAYQNSFPQDLSIENSLDKKAHSLLDSQNDLNKAIIYQSSTEKLPLSKKYIDNQIVLAEILEDKADGHENVVKMEEEGNKGESCSCFQDDKQGSSCSLI